MALDFSNATSDKVNHGTDSSLDNMTVATVMLWCYVTVSGDTDLALWCKSGLSKRLAINPAWYSGVNIARSTLSLNATATAANFAHYGINKWMFFVSQYDTGGADGDQKVFVGDLSNLAAEPSAYQFQRVGSGTVEDDSATDLTVGGSSGNIWNFKSFIANIHIVKRALSLGEIYTQQFRLAPVADSVLLSQYGFAGDASSTQPDWSGNGNNGTVTGATVSAHVPIPVFPFQTWMPEVSAGDLSVSYPFGGVSNFDTYNENLTQSYPTAVSLGQS